MIADAQARQWIIAVLKDAVQNLEAGSPIPFERTPETVYMLQTGAAFTDDETGQAFYPVVFALVSVAEARQSELAQALVKVFRMRQ